MMRCGRSCSGEETARADWDFKIAYWARNFSLDKDDRAAFWEDQDKWSKSLKQKCGLSAPPFSHQQTSCVIDAYKERAALYRSKLSGDALAESQMSPEQLFQIQQALITPGFFHGEADGEFGPVTRPPSEGTKKRTAFRRATIYPGSSCRPCWSDKLPAPLTPKGVPLQVSPRKSICSRNPHNNPLLPSVRKMRLRPSQSRSPRHRRSIRSSRLPTSRALAARRSQTIASLW
jgi:hypothetical protein